MTEIKSKTLVQLRPSSDDSFPAEICVLGQDDVFRVYAVSEGALINLLREGTDLLGQYTNKT
jgi:hypothetical protein